MGLFKPKKSGKFKQLTRVDFKKTEPDEFEKLAYDAMHDCNKLRKSLGNISYKVETILEILENKKLIEEFDKSSPNFISDLRNIDKLTTTILDRLPLFPTSDEPYMRKQKSRSFHDPKYVEEISTTFLRESSPGKKDSILHLGDMINTNLRKSYGDIDEKLRLVFDAIYKQIPVDDKGNVNTGKTLKESIDERVAELNELRKDLSDSLQHLENYNEHNTYEKTTTSIPNPKS